MTEPDVRPAGAVRRAVLDAIGVLVPVACVGCGAVDRAVCGSCRAVLLGTPPHLAERPGLGAWAALRYEGVVASAIGAYKDGGRTDAAGSLAGALGGAIAAALRGLPPGTIEVCTVPSTSAAMRARGYAPVDLLLARCGIRPSNVLRLTRAHEDQAGLGAAARRTNAEGALEARRTLEGRRFLLVDDVLTTGSTLMEARRALACAGGSVAAVAVLAETPLRRPPHTATSRETLRDNATRGGYGGRTGVVDPPFQTRVTRR
ncbi:ComF family protein [Agromyces bauzanensis]